MRRTFPWGRPMLPLYANKTLRAMVKKANRKARSKHYKAAAQAKALDGISRMAWQPDDQPPQLRKAPR